MPQLYLIAALAWAASVAAAGWYGMGLGEDRCIARAAKDQQVEDRAVAAAAAAAASAVASIEVRHVTVRQKLEREIQTREVFRECRSGPVALGLLNSGAASPPAEPASASKLP
jgi:hypothetical protein